LPHPTNVQMKIDYLSGGDAVFGANYGEAKVLTVTAGDYSARCPNVSKLVSNLQFTTDIENHVMLPIMNKTDPSEAARAWLKDIRACWTNGWRGEDVRREGWVAGGEGLYRGAVRVFGLRVADAARGLMAACRRHRTLAVHSGSQRFTAVHTRHSSANPPAHLPLQIACARPGNVSS
jgi:hypothetical protein